MTHVFTYGSLMFDAVWQSVVKQHYTSEAYTLNGFERRALRDADFPAAIYNTNKSILGRLYHNIHPRDLERLNYFESSYYNLHKQPQSEEISTNIAIYVIKPEYEHLLLAHDWDAIHFKNNQLQKFLTSYSGYFRP